MKDGVLMLKVQKDIKESEQKVMLSYLLFIDSTALRKNSSIVKEG